MAHPDTKHTIAFRALQVVIISTYGIIRKGSEKGNQVTKGKEWLLYKQH